MPAWLEHRRVPKYYLIIIFIVFNNIHIWV
jgi:hypothetical protein